MKSIIRTWIGEAVHHATQFVPDGSMHWQVVELIGDEYLSKVGILVYFQLSKPQLRSENPLGQDDVKVP